MFTSNVYRNMSDQFVPNGWTRKRVGRKIVYICEPPKIQIWNIKEFDRLKKKGRFLHVNRDTLNFSTKVRNKGSLPNKKTPENRKG